MHSLVLNGFGPESIKQIQMLPLVSWASDHGFDFFDERGEKVLRLGLPLNYPRPIDESNIKDYLDTYQVIRGKVWVIIIQAGECILGILEDGTVQKHRLIRKYMVRKKQGKAQISHLNTKGKSRAGSRIRLKQGIAFFEEINTCLQSWYDDTPPSLILYSISPTLKSHWFNAKVNPPFEVDDFRNRKINWSIKSPRSSELKRALYHINLARMSIFDLSYAETIESINKG